MSEKKVVSISAPRAAANSDEPSEPMLLGVSPLPIDNAPVQSGIKFGPCLLYEPAPGHQGSNHQQLTLWFIGGWDGEGWYQLSGYYVNPTHWAPLPRDPD